MLACLFSVLDDNPNLNEYKHLLNIRSSCGEAISCISYESFEIV